MRKFIYLILVVTLVSVSISSCTEESIAPTRTDSSAGGGGMDPKGDK